nr:reverse transcriptase domain-containing protein [Tanacetum cinerariifolium]
MLCAYDYYVNNIRTREPVRRNNETIGELDGQGNDRGVEANGGARRAREPVRRYNETIGELDGQGNDRGVEANEGFDGVPDFPTIITQQFQNLLPTLLAQGDVRNIIMSNDRKGCTCKEFLACNPKEYDGKGGAIVYTPWIEKMKSVQDMSGCRDNQKVKYIVGSFVGKAQMWWNSQIHT